MLTLGKFMRVSAIPRLLNLVILCIAVLVVLSCNDEEEIVCIDENIEGSYLFYTDSDTSSQNLEIEYMAPNKFETNGISGYGFWFPSAPLSGEIVDCQIVLDSYQDVEREGLSSPGGTPRKYYESMSGHGEFYNAEDSIVLHITYTRTGDFPFSFDEDVHFVLSN